jgi:hypothetical protein
MPVKEQFQMAGSQVVDKVRQLIREGNVRRVRLIHDGKTLIELPLSIGAPAAVIGILWLPVLAAVGAAAALLTECTLEVEKMEDTP